MKNYNIGKYEIIAQDNMIVSFTEDKKILTVINKREKEVHCIIELDGDKLNLESGWNVKYSFYNNILKLDYIFVDEDN